MDCRPECKPDSGAVVMELQIEIRPNSGPDTPADRIRGAIFASQHFWNTLALPLWNSGLLRVPNPQSEHFWNIKHRTVYVREV